MALGITRNSATTKYEIPLFYGDDKNWIDKTWMIEHLRQLADKIENESIEIMNVGLDISLNGKVPNLFIEVFENEQTK